MELRNENLPVTRLHGDRAHEFFSAPLRSWALDRDVEVTRTEGQSPQSNGTAESAVRYLKGRVKLLLGASKLPMQMWPSAFTTAAHQGGRTKESLSIWIACPSQTEGLWARGKI